MQHLMFAEVWPRWEQANGLACLCNPGWPWGCRDLKVIARQHLSAVGMCEVPKPRLLTSITCLVLQEAGQLFMTAIRRDTMTLWRVWDAGVWPAMPRLLLSLYPTPTWRLSTAPPYITHQISPAYWLSCLSHHNSCVLTYTVTEIFLPRVETSITDI